MQLGEDTQITTEKTISGTERKAGARSGTAAGKALGAPQLNTMLQFQGKWRSYQKRVLDRAEEYLKDKRVHIVAAPGSGKTTLGIELIRRLNAPCLILAPSITIRDQWLGRIRDAYLTETEPESASTACKEAKGEAGLLSNSLKNPGIITAITYQALHSSMTRYKGTLKEDGENAPEEKEEDVDFTDFDLIAFLKRNGVRTLCLDEAHHLRSEWWKALEELVKEMPELTVVSLTATPPYDSTPAQWERYVGLCGPIDEEIIVPELVKEGSLCPHQDYVYFNMPTEEEKQAVLKFKAEAAQTAEALLQDGEFAGIIASHAGLAAPEEYADIFLEKTEYLSALLIFLNAKDISFSGRLLRMLGNNGKLPPVTMKWLEVLLQGFLYEDIDSYSCSKAYREDMISRLKAHGLVQKNKVCLVANDSINKLLTTSKGKINSIIEVTKAEYVNLREDLRLLILTDYIKKEYVSAIGNEEKSVNELGVIPIFENIRRAFSGVRTEKNTTARGERVTSGDLRIGVLSGTVVIVPECAKNALEDILKEKNAKGTMKECASGGFYQISVSGTEHTAASIVTELFNQGYIRVLIGTKSLLGEGWDSPCINALVLASFVGSFMLSNQMRGRAIRTMKGNPDKVSNIWHLICMEPELEKEQRNTEKTEKGQENRGTGKTAGNGSSLQENGESQDFSTLRRRFEGFLGLHYEKDVIENRLDRLSYIKPLYTAPLLEKINGQMVMAASDRSFLKKRWDTSLTALNKMEVAAQAGADKAYFKPGLLLAGACLTAAVWAALFFFVFVWGVLPGISGRAERLPGFWTLLLCGADLFFLLKSVKHGRRIYTYSSPGRYMKSIGRCILAALQKYGVIMAKGVSVCVDETEPFMSYIYLMGGSEREKDVFAQCVCEFFGTVEKQRYLLKAQKPVPRLCRYYCVPEIFGKRKEDAAMFRGYVKKYTGNYELIYTKSGEGKKKLLEARVYSVANKGELCTDKKKKVVNGI